MTLSVDPPPSPLKAIGWIPMRESETTPFMSEWAGLTKALLDRIGIPAFIAIPLGVLFLPDGVSKPLQLLNLRDKFGMWFGLMLLVGLGMLLEKVLRSLKEAGGRRKKEGKARQRIEKMRRIVNELDQSAVDLLREANSRGSFKAPRYGTTRQMIANINELLRLGLIEEFRGLHGPSFRICYEHRGSFEALVAESQQRARDDL